MLVMLTMFFKHSTSLTIALRCFYETLLGLEVNELLHLLMALINSLFEKEGQYKKGFKVILSKIFMLTCWFWTELNVQCKAC